MSDDPIVEAPVADTETQDSQPEEELVLDLEPEEEQVTPTEDVEALKAKLAEVEAKNQKLYARLKKGEVKQAEPTTNKSEATDPTGERLSKLELAEAKRQFAWEHKLSPEETDKVFQITQHPTAETLKDPFIRYGLQGIRKMQRVSEATPSSSSRGQTFNGKSFHELSEEDQKKNYPAFIRGLKK